MAAALQNNCIRAPKLGGRTSLTAVLRVVPAGLRRARSFSAAAPPVQLGGVAQGHTIVLGLIPFLSVRLFSKVFAKSLFRWLVSVRSLRSTMLLLFANFDRGEKNQRCSVHRAQSTITSSVPHTRNQVSALSPRLEAKGLNPIRLTKVLKDPITYKFIFPLLGK